MYIVDYIMVIGNIKRIYIEYFTVYWNTIENFIIISNIICASYLEDNNTNKNINPKN